MPFGIDYRRRGGPNPCCTANCETAGETAAIATCRRNRRSVTCGDFRRFRCRFPTDARDRPLAIVRLSQHVSGPALRRHGLLVLLCTCIEVRSQPRAGGRERGRPAGAEPRSVSGALRRAPVGLFADRTRRAYVIQVLTSIATHIARTRRHLWAVAGRPASGTSIRITPSCLDVRRSSPSAVRLMWRSTRGRLVPIF